MKYLILLIVSAILLSFNTLIAQEYQILDNKLVQIKSKDSSQTKDIKTDYTVVKGDREYPVYKSKKGKFYIIRTSKNTNKKYKQYLKVQLR